MVQRFAASLLAGLLLASAGSISANAATAQIFIPPAGWNAISGDTLTNTMENIWQGPLPFSTEQAKLVGMWTGNEPIQMLTLAQGRALTAPAEMARLFPARDVSHGPQVQYHVATQPYNFCGAPGTLTNVRFGGFMGFTMAYDIAVAQAGGVSYILSYFHLADQTDPAAERALRSLCPRVDMRRVQPTTQH